MSRKFQRKIEDFVCEHCGENVVGDGFTNHCPVCLWSKHVDVNPGDREAECGGLMEPISVELKNGKYRILQKCVECGHERWNKTVEKDSFEAIIEISRKMGDILY